MLEARDLAIGYGTRRIGDGLDLSVRPGDILCLLGPNGCGKTTLFRTLLGLLPALAGDVRLGGVPITAQCRAEIARRIAYVPQAHAPPFPFDALGVVLMGRTARLGVFAQPGFTDGEAARKARDRLGIGDLADRDYSRLSGGQRQLVLIARALAQIATLAREASKEERGVILSTHDPDQAFALHAWVLLMHDGGVWADRPAPDVPSDANLGRVYGIPITVETTSSGRRVCLPALAGQSAPTMTSDALTTA